MNIYLKENIKYINHIKKNGNWETFIKGHGEWHDQTGEITYEKFIWYTEPDKYTCEDLILLNQYKTKAITLDRFISEAVAIIISNYKKGLNMDPRSPEFSHYKPRFLDKTVPTWYKFWTEDDYKEVIQDWFIYEFIK